MTVLQCVLTCLLLFTSIEAGRILAVFPAPFISHQVVFRPITQELAKRGHEVVVITTIPAFKTQEAPANLTEIDINVAITVWRELLEKSPIESQSRLAQYQLMIDAIVPVWDAALKDIGVKTLLEDKTQKFDLILSESGFRGAIVFSQIYKAPVIQVSSMGALFDNYEVIGAPVHPFLYPSTSRERINNLTVWEKIYELYQEYALKQMLADMQIKENKMLQTHFGPDLPSTNELLDNVHMLLLNIHPIFEGIRPVPPNVIYMGGIHQLPSNELPQDLKKYLDASKNGVMYVSFGTNIDPALFPPEIVQMFVRAFSALPYDVLWKWNNDELPERNSNIKIAKWLPQSDLLKHPKIKLFITQGGLQSTDEAITAGVPMIGIPMLGDQTFNVEMYVFHKIGIRLDLPKITSEKLEKAINTITSDDSYRQNIVRLRNIIMDEPMRPLERAIWWIEYVLRHGGAKHLRSPAANISWSEYLEAELVLTIVGILVTALTLLLISLRLIYKSVMKKFVSFKTKND